jgi:cellulose synthase/poly-beta-1,6-N-acetylglucosamine synthase-like glycosyltransferase
MAFTTTLYKECLENLQINGAGFDKVLQYEILKRGYRIAFAERAIVYDEKTSKSDQLVKQRARWINTSFRYFNLGFDLTFRGVLTLNWNRFIFGLMLMRPPLFIVLLTSFLCFAINLVFYPVMALVWIAAFLIFVSVFFLALAHYKADNLIYRSLLNVPQFIYYQLVALLFVKKANKLSVATRHYVQTRTE